VGYKHDRTELVDAAVTAAVEDGLSQLTFGRLAKRLGISDRMIVYYFPSKDDLITEVVLALGVELQALLAVAFGDDRLPVEQLAMRAWPVLTTRAADRIFGVFFELTGLAAAGIEPFASMAPAALDSWVDWVATYVAGSNKDVRYRRAVGLVAQLDGLLLIRQLCGDRLANVAAGQLGFR
jgi:AcrR family transcriptional regulator